MTLDNKLFLHAFSKKQKEANKLLTKSDHTCGKKDGAWNMANKKFLGKSLPIPKIRMSGFKLAKDIDCPVSAVNATWELLGKSADSREARGIGFNGLNIKISTFDAKEAQGKSYTLPCQIETPGVLLGLVAAYPPRFFDSDGFFYS